MNALSATQSKPLIDDGPLASPLNHVVYIVAKVFTDRDHERFGIGVMVERGIRVTVIEAQQIIFPERGGNRDHYGGFSEIQLRAPRNRSELQGELDTLRAADLVLFMCETHGVCRSNLPIARLIAKAKTPYLIWDGPSQPGADLIRFRNQSFPTLWDLGKALLKKDYLDSVISRVPEKYFGLKPAEYVVYTSPGNRRPKSLAGPETQVIATHVPDYDLFRRAELTDREPSKRAVFIDQFLVGHPDFLEWGTEMAGAPETYFGQLNALFRHVEEAFGLEVVIAAHPSADYDRFPNCFEGRQLVSGETAGLICDSRLVMCHHSLAINFAVLSRLPILLLTSDVINRIGFLDKLIAEHARELALAPVYLDRFTPQALTSLPAVDDAVYGAYERKYIKSPDTPDRPVWEIVANHLEAQAKAQGQTAAPSRGT